MTLATSRRAAVARVLLIVIGTLVLLIAWCATRMPKAGGPRLEATLEVVGVDTGGSYAWVIHTGKGAALVDCGIDARGSAILGELSRLGPRSSFASFFFAPAIVYCSS